MATSSFVALMARLRAGDQQAAALIFQQFAQQLIALARLHLNQRLRQKEDPEDVMQSVFKSFFRRHAGGELDLENWDSLWGLLTVITLRKCGHRVERFRAACRDVQREVSFMELAPGESWAGWEAMAREPTPSEAAMLAEAIERLMRSLEHRDRRILQLTLEGETVAEVSAAVGCSERTVERLLVRIRQRLEQWRDQDPQE